MIENLALRDLADLLVLPEVKQQDNSGKADGSTLFEASNDSEDRYDSIVKQDWSLGNYRANPVVLDSHDYKRVVGRAVEAKVPRAGDDTGKLMIRVAWATDAPDPSLAVVGWQHQNGFRSAGSVGWKYSKVTERDRLPTDHKYFRQKQKKTVEFFGMTFEIETAGILYENNELLEFSSVAVPGNATALQRSYLAALSAVAPDDIPARLRIVQETAPRRVGEDLAAQLRDPAQRALAVDLLWPDLVQRMRTDAETRRVLRALLEAGPPAVPPAAAAAPTPSLAGLVLRRLQEATP